MMYNTHINILINYPMPNAWHIWSGGTGLVPLIYIYTVGAPVIG